MHCDLYFYQLTILYTPLIPTFSAPPPLLKQHPYCALLRWSLPSLPTPGLRLPPTARTSNFLACPSSDITPCFQAHLGPITLQCVNEGQGLGVRRALLSRVTGAPDWPCPSRPGHQRSPLLPPEPQADDCRLSRLTCCPPTRTKARLTSLLQVFS